MVADGVISIRPKPPAADDGYTPEQRRIVEAQLAASLADVKAGRVHGPFSTHEDFIASLHQEAKRLNRKNVKRSGDEHAFDKQSLLPLQKLPALSLRAK